MEAYIVKIIDEKSKRSITLPMTPRDLTKSGSAIVKNFETIVSGDIPRPKGREAFKNSLYGIIPDEGFDIPTYSDITPSEFEVLLDDWIEGRGAYNKKLKIIVSDTSINTFAFLNDFEIDYSGGGRMIKYRIDFTEWRDFGIKVYDKNKTSSESKRPAKPKPKTYVIKKGDNLSKIARALSGKSSNWPALYKLNKGNLKSGSPHKIYPGEKLNIPPEWSK